MMNPIAPLTNEEIELLRDEQAFMPVLPTYKEVVAQPEILARTLANLQPKVLELAILLAQRNCNRILIMGSGDSYFAAAAARLAFEKYADIQVEAFQAFEYATYGAAAVDERTAIFVISSSGRPTTTWDALDRGLKTQALVIGITDTPYPGNPFAERPPFVLVPGATKAGWPTQTTTTTLAVLLSLAVSLGLKNGNLDVDEAEYLLNELRQIPEKAVVTLQENMTVSRELARLLHQKHYFTLIGGGPNLAVANIGNALLAEGSQKAGIVYEVEEFNHSLRACTILSEDPVFLIAPNGLCLRRLEETIPSLKQQNALIITIVDGEDSIVAENANYLLRVPKTLEEFSPLLTLLPLHLLSLYIAIECIKSGYQRPENPV